MKHLYCDKFFRNIVQPYINVKHVGPKPPPQNLEWYISDYFYILEYFL